MNRTHIFYKLLYSILDPIEEYFQTGDTLVAANTHSVDDN